VLYSPVTEALAKAGIVPHYCANITGHGWRKLLRHPAVLHLPHPHLPPVPEVLRSSSSTPGRTTARPTARSTWARASRCSSPPAEAERTVASPPRGHRRAHAGQVETGPKQLRIEPLGIEWGDDALQLR
jgi:phosphoribosylformylglycinamidine cyclo-ligase